MKTSWFPSGDQSGWQAPSGISVIWRSAVPSEFITQIWGSPVRFEAKAISPVPPPTGVMVGVGVIVDWGVAVASLVNAGVFVKTVIIVCVASLSVKMVGSGVLVATVGGVSTCEAGSSVVINCGTRELNQARAASTKGGRME